MRILQKVIAPGGSAPKKKTDAIQVELSTNPAISKIADLVDDEILNYDLQIETLQKVRKRLLEIKRTVTGSDARHNKQKRPFYIERQKKIRKMYFEMLMPNRAIAEELGMNEKALESQITKIRDNHPEEAAKRDAAIKQSRSRGTQPLAT